METIAFEPLKVQLRKRAFARLLRSRLQVSAAFCGHHALRVTARLLDESAFK